MSHSARLALEAVVRHEGRIIGRCLVKRGRYVIGQDRKNEIIVNAESVSSRHARLTVMSDTEFVVEDLDSANGTFVDGVSAAHSQPANLDSIITIGTATLSFQRGGIPASVFEHLQPNCLRFPRYKLGEVVVQGNTSTIFTAQDTAIGRDVAMKVLLPESQADSTQVIRFIRDARIAGQLQHPGILPVYEFGLDDESHLFSVTRFVEGETLRQMLDDLPASEPLSHSLPALIEIFQRVCEVVAYAHSRGVIHGGLTPDIITVGRYGEVFVAGWGNARILPAPDAVTPIVTAPELSAHPALGRYTTPEQAEGAHDTIDEKTDIHALGDILYCIITLRDAATGETDEDLLDQALSPRVAPAVAMAKQPPCRHWANGKLPEFLCAIAMRALSVEREERHASVGDMQKEITAWREGLATGEAGKLWKHFTGILGRH